VEEDTAVAAVLVLDKQCQNESVLELVEEDTRRAKLVRQKKRIDAVVKIIFIFNKLLKIKYLKSLR
jgi:hypothetical protein